MGHDDPSRQDTPENTAPPGKAVAAEARGSEHGRDCRPVWQRLAPIDSWTLPHCNKAPEEARGPGALHTGPQHGETEDEQTDDEQTGAVWQTRLELQGQRAAGAGLTVTLAAAALWLLWPGLTPADDAQRLPPDAAGLVAATQWPLAPGEPAAAADPPDAPSPQLFVAVPVVDLAAALSVSPAAACIPAAAAIEHTPPEFAQPRTIVFEPGGVTADSRPDLAAFSAGHTQKAAQKAAPARHARGLSRKEAAAPPPAAPAPAIIKARTAAKLVLARTEPAGPLRQIAHGVDIAGTGAQSGLTNLVLGVRRLLAPRRAKSG